MKNLFFVPCIETIQKFIPDFNPDEPAFIKTIRKFIPEFNPDKPAFTFELSFDNPPLLEQRANDNVEVYGIDGLLGLYIAQKKLIRIFIKGIQYVNDLQQIPSTDLYIIVLMHEIGHFYCHEFEIEGTRWDTNRFLEAKSCVHEYLAQLFTYYSVKDSKDWMASFLKLAEHQTIEYQRFNGSTDLPFELFNKLIEYLRLSNGTVSIYSIGDFLFSEYFNPSVQLKPKRYNDFIDFISNDLEVKYWAYLGGRYGFFDEYPRFKFKQNILSCTSLNSDCLCRSIKIPYNDSEMRKRLGK